MKTCLVDVLNARDTVLHVFPIPVEGEDGTPKPVDPEREALRLAAMMQLVPETETAALHARQHVSRGAQLTPYSPENSVIRQLASFERLALHERELIWKNCKDATTYAPNSLVKMDEDAHYFLISGWACRQWIREDGRQQIIDFVLPGDTITPIRSPKHASTVSLVTLTSARFASATSVHQLVSNDAQRYSGLTKAFAAAVNAEYQRLFDQLIRLGTLSATERLADLLSELYRRLELVGFASQGRFECPLTQRKFAEALGTSAIHMNRIFQLLERGGKISRSSSWISLRELHSPCTRIANANMGRTLNAA